MSSEILEKQPFSTASVACGCCSLQASKKSPAGGKHRASEGRASSEILPLLHAAAATAAALAAGAAKLACLIPWRAPPCVCRGRRIRIQYFQ